jgi:G:T/U-mismatch repair DNA glycosylase
MSDHYIEETHPEWYHDIPEMKVLILGNFPPHKKRWDYEFYYPNKQNNFWKVLSAISGKPLKWMKGAEAVAERKAIMEKLGVGVFNIARKVLRKGYSARDTDIQILEYNDVLEIIQKHLELKKIILAGFSAENSTAKKFIEYLRNNNVRFDEPHKISAGTEFLIHLGRRKIKCVVLNSTSTAFPIKLERLTEQFLPHIRT